ncbi:hypothetical protein NKW85_10240 [Staphylococcus simulans]|uniref:Lipoprotein n=1 Tax=Staphylococcus simulans UMC-CNS-990 TaxID=1405498 RepID=A0ABN0PDQ0_STASI|nr:hypothetical protein [Staphylococcus simulans]ERS93611.1 hypothetical protein SSIM_05275 [Staphylococcus simulans UMC-CNS-990]MCE5148641.1 hypothetical protein [Staphylococcus simulans]PTI91907.1 hypothetical protein BU045_11400 [Staphylococcus simulans]PTJ08325.1 hypothetical protein BU044_12775 [Staphylococcus simulans]PTJ33991.1 hypothetical protein BU026_03235 [Staphylococcus simulans]
MKKLFALLAMSILIVSACGQNDEKPKEDTEDKAATEKKDKSQSKNEENEKKKQTDKNQQKENNTQNEQQANTEQQNKDESTAEKQNQQNQQSQQVDLSNITDRATLENVIYGNYAEIDKIKAYNSAVANGVIPQGNVTEGPASAAYESSLRVESGAEQSVYNQNAQSQAEEPTEDVNAEINAAQTEEEYIDALRKKYNGGLSSAEIQTKHAIEQGYYDGDEAEQQAVYDEIERREADIEAGKFDHYKQ